jgi:DNA-binding transcriptional regulator YdaS (Cro superfamily)
MSDALKKAIDVFGSQAGLAEALGLSAMAITQWKKRGVPPERCRDIERVTHGKVKRAHLRPDHFGRTAVSDTTAAI